MQIAQKIPTISCGDVRSVDSVLWKEVAICDVVESSFVGFGDLGFWLASSSFLRIVER
jgi:hypothetical protein